MHTLGSEHFKVRFSSCHRKWRAQKLVRKLQKRWREPSQANSSEVSSNTTGGVYLASMNLQLPPVSSNAHHAEAACQQQCPPC
eukprot:910883-Pelagomonas_calceolata.AAC.1